MVEIDYSVSKHGHLKLKKGGNDLCILSKSLSELNPFPFSQREMNLLDSFDVMKYAWVSTR
jgi:hypothetical protein